MADVIAHFETGAYRPNKTFLEDAEYARALDCFVKGCADVLIQDESTGQVLIGRRAYHPQPDWWYIGGRMQAGFTPEQQARRNVRRETGLDLPPDRFSPLCVMSMLWQWRRQAPADNGTADVAVVCLCRVKAEERARVKLDAQEYRGSMWLAPAELAGGEGYHPCLRRAAQHILVRQRHAEMAAAAAAAPGAASDAALAAAARAYLEATRVAKEIAAKPVAFVDVPEATAAATAAPS